VHDEVQASTRLEVAKSSAKLRQEMMQMQRAKQAQSVRDASQPLAATSLSNVSVKAVIEAFQRGRF
jgi:hypothetical protein